jgi:alpha-tubulin suppressor-like RCC1 family protein
MNEELERRLISLQRVVKLSVRHSKSIIPSVEQTGKKTNEEAATEAIILYSWGGNFFS